MHESKMLITDNIEYKFVCSSIKINYLLGTKLNKIEDNNENV
jgi:hypothetical protein